MKIYTQTYDLSKASPHRFWVAPYSEFKIGIKLLEKDEISDKDFTLKAGSVEFTPDEDKIDNFTLFTIKSNDTGFVEYTIEVEGVAEKLKLMQIVTDSTVFEIDASGGDVPADVATQTWVNSQISDFVENGDLTAYYTKSETSSAAELSDAFANVGGGAISAYTVSDSPIQSETLIRQALVDNTCLPQTVALNQDGTIQIFDVEGTLDLHTEGPLASLIPNAVKVLVGTKVTSLAGRCFIHAFNCKDIVFPNSLSAINGQEVFSGINAQRIAFPDSLANLGSGMIFWNYSNGKVIDFGNTRQTIPTGGDLRNNNANLKFLVPDSLYSQWITTGSWATVSAQVFPHSYMPSAVTGGAYAGTTGTPAAVNAVKSVYETDWATLSATADASTFYVVLPDPA